MKKTLLTDCDGVLLNWLSGVPAFLEDQGQDSSHLKARLEGNQFVPIEELFVADDTDGALARLGAYHSSDHLKSLPVMEPGSEASLKRLSDEYEIIVVTSFSEDPIAQQNRADNLELRYGDSISDLVCLAPFADKTEALRKLARSRDAYIWLDDQIKHVYHGHNAGIPSYQFSYGMACGQNTGEVPELASWAEVEEIMALTDSMRRQARSRGF